MHCSCITLLTDFGLQDTYVGQMKGVIFGINPSAVVVDLTHAIPPQQILEGSLSLANSIAVFPPGTIHVAVVDPGVGTSRRAIAAEIGPYKFVCPDNGLLTLVLRKNSLHRAVELDDSRWWRPNVSPTFHGRDVFAPVAAALSLGRPLSELGSPISTPLVELSWPEVQREAGDRSGTLRGQIMAVDHFGNLITNISRSAIKGRDLASLEVDCRGRTLPAVKSCYGDCAEGECIALFGSSEWLEIAIVNGNAQGTLQAGVGEPVTVRWTT